MNQLFTLFAFYRTPYLGTFRTVTGAKHGESEGGSGAQLHVKQSNTVLSWFVS